MCFINVILYIMYVCMYAYVFATHRKVEVKIDEVKINPLKASKRGGR